MLNVFDYETLRFVKRVLMCHSASLLEYVQTDRDLRHTYHDENVSFDEVRVGLGINFYW